MVPFIGLVKKDMLLGRFSYITWFIGCSLFVLGAYFLSVRVEEQFVLVSFLIGVVLMHALLGPLMMLSLLRIEGRTQLWLYNPQNSFKLLLAKCLTTALFLFASQLLFSLLTLASIHWFLPPSINGVVAITSVLSVRQFTLINAVIFAGSMYIAVWVVFLWVIYHSLGKIPFVKNVRWLIVIFTVILSSVLENFISRLRVVQDLLYSWTVDINFTTSFLYNSGVDQWTAEYSDIAVPIMPIVIYALVALVLFYAASKLLDKKVEV